MRQKAPSLELTVFPQEDDWFVFRDGNVYRYKEVMLFCWGFGMVTLYLETDYRKDGWLSQEDPRIPARVPHPKPGPKGRELISRVLPGHVLLRHDNRTAQAFLPGNVHHIDWKIYVDRYGKEIDNANYLTVYMRDHGYQTTPVSQRKNHQSLIDLWNPETGQWDEADRHEFSARMETLGVPVELKTLGPENDESAEDDPWVQECNDGPAPYRETRIDILPTAKARGLKEER